MTITSKTTLSSATALMSLGLLLTGCSPAEETNSSATDLSTERTTDDGVPVPAPEVYPDYTPAPGPAVTPYGPENPREEPAGERVENPQSCFLEMDGDPKALNCAFGRTEFDVNTTDQPIDDSSWKIDNVEMIEYEGDSLWTVVFSGADSTGKDLRCTASNVEDDTEVSCTTPGN